MHSPKPLILVLGPARSGKSEWAETLARESGRHVVYVATAKADPHDREWQTRLQQHRDRRPPTWETLEVPIDLATTLRTASPDSCLLVDSLGSWLANLLEQDEPAWQQTVTDLLASFQASPAPTIVVAEEVGWGVVPAYPLGRAFRDRLGHLVQQLGAIAHTTYLVTGGHILNLSKLGTPLNKPLTSHP